MRSRPSDSNTKKVEGPPATETDPLITTSTADDGLSRNTTASYSKGSIRARRSSKSPSALQQLHFQANVKRGRPSGLDRGGQPMDRTPGMETPHGDLHHEPPTSGVDPTYNSTDSPYEIFNEGNPNRPQQQQGASYSGRRLDAGPPTLDHGEIRRHEGIYRPQTTEGPTPNQPERQGEQPLFEMPEEIYAVRKAALKVMKPLTATWLVFSIGFSLTALLATVRWTNLINDLPYWFILLPSWLSHVGLLWCHISSAKALSTFIAEANDNRQRPDSTDHLDRTEYLPLLQRSLKFGLKTGLLSFCIFVFEVLVYLRIARGSVSLAVTFIPVWLLVGGGIIDGIICKTQHLLKLLCWILVFSAMILMVLKVDYGIDEIRWRIIISPLVAVLSISSGLLIYIVYGHQVGYYRLTEAQLTAGILYSMASLIFIVLLVVVVEVIPLDRPVEVETRFLVVIMTPMVVCLVGMGAWAVSRDEFARLLLYGGQAAVHPMRLRLEAKGWTSVESNGVTTIPMFGEVSYKPLEKSNVDSIELCSCCACYPYEDDDEGVVQYPEQGVRWENPYLAPSSTQHSGESPGTYAEPPRMAV